MPSSLARPLLLGLAGVVAGLLAWVALERGPGPGQVLAAERAPADAESEPAKRDAPSLDADEAGARLVVDALGGLAVLGDGGGRLLVEDPLTRPDVPTFDEQRDSPIVAPWTSRRGLLQDLAQQLSNAELVQDLRDDDERWNATAALLELGERMDQAEHVDVIRGLLEQVLQATDRRRQQKRLALGLLMATSRKPTASGARYVPDATTREHALRRLDRWWPHRGIGTEPHAPTKLRTLAFAVEFAAELEVGLREMLASEYTEPRLAAAYALARGGRYANLTLVTPILVGHLADNDIEDDALMAVEALVHLGPATWPYLAEASLGADAQQAECIELLHTEFTGGEGVPAGQRTNLTWKCSNPARSWHYLDLDWMLDV